VERDATAIRRAARSALPARYRISPANVMANVFNLCMLDALPGVHIVQANRLTSQVRSALANPRPQYSDEMET